MTDEDRILDLLVEWEEKRRQGSTLLAEHLCPDDPALQEELRRRITRRLNLQALIEPASSTTSGEPLPEIEGYDVLGVLGHGGMGVVYRARQRSLNRVVALKMILATGASPSERARFRVEAEAVAALQHPNIVQVYQTGEANGRPFLALEYVAGGSLADQLHGGPLAPGRAAELVESIARAVQHAHERGVVHRDLKPGNVLLAPLSSPLAGSPPHAEANPQAGRMAPKIADFGLAKRAVDSGLTATGTVLGTPSYMAPEQARGRIDEVCPATDVWALGAILYECLTGRPPFLGDSPMQTLQQVIDHDPAPPASLNPVVPRDLEVITLKCLEKQPERRYASAGALADDLRRYLDNEPIRARSATFLDHLTRSLSRRQLHPRFREWGRVVFLLAPLPVLLLGSFVLAFGDRPDFPYIILAVSAVAALGMRQVLFRVHRAALLDLPAIHRRHFRAIWGGNSVAMLVLVFVVWWTTPADQPERLFLVYPLWLVAVSTVFFAFASWAGVMYVLGGLALVLAMVAVTMLHWSPLLVAGFATINLMTLGIYLSRMEPRR